MLTKLFNKMKNYMKNEKNLIIIVTIILILFIIFFIYYQFYNSKSKSYISEAQIKEDFSSSSSSILNYPRNLITNGNFNGGKRPDEYISQSGSNMIVAMKNPAASGYVLKQSKTSPATLTYYELQTYCDNNTKYTLLIWSSFSNNDSKNQVSNIDLSKIINVRVLKTDGTNNIPKIDYKIIQKVNLEDNVDTWYLTQYSWTTPESTDNLQNIYINYTDTLQSDNQYFVGLKLYKVLPEAPNFIYNDKLNLYLDGYHATANSTTWNDVSTYNNDFTLTNKPAINQSYGYVNTNNNIFTGKTSKELFGDSDTSFTFVLVMTTDNNTSDNVSLSGLDDDDNDWDTSTILTIPGNNTYSLKLLLDKTDKSLIMKLPGSKTYTSKKNLILNNETMISIIYEKGGKIRLYQDGNKLIDNTTDKFYYSATEKVQINQNKDLDINLYAVLNYNRVVSDTELNEIRRYFITNQNKDFNSITINTSDLSYDSSYYKNDWTNVTPYNKRDPTQAYSYDNEFNTQYSNQTYLFQTDPKYCIPQANTVCQSFIDDIQKYQECMRNARSVIPSCKNYCDNNKNKNSLICEPEKCDGPNKFSEKDCPTAYKRFGEYMVYIKPNSYYAKEMQYSGEKSYGKSLENARTMYTMNFPKCPLPSNIKPGEGKNTLDKCPYVIHEGNPCYQTACAGVDWSESNYKNIDMSDKCKKSISYYCQINSDLDDMCKCWREENKENPKCVEYRKFFENPKDYCPTSSFNIEDHPNINQYIKKDNIPCFGCKIE